eukprot:CAMPEP_0180794952 /NCGR_PEP_ID=MMETSP1038_2-20121128/55926_1 /TAXON_ID=632150 /ORGANISM="Azadinium spinosum, Strain 3D9" /LENGTH=31 /DNA_ID= /DNA_START= /DNA_END= /DNA_ORIENTATION=
MTGLQEDSGFYARPAYVGRSGRAKAEGPSPC